MNEANDQPDEEPAPPEGITRIAGEVDETQAGEAGLAEASAVPIEVRQIAATRSQSDIPLDDEFSGVPKVINNRYALKRFLGQGGYATVYEAWDGVLCRSVAIKIPRTERFRSKRILDEFLTEARTAARLKHKSIVAVHDVGWTADGKCFIVLDYLAGGTLSEALVRQPHAADHAAHLMADVAEAVAYANEQGLIHRDLKPSNILLDAEGRPHVTDFGLAAFEESPKLKSEDVVGTPAYMAPEQVRGENHRLDGRTDLWGLGVIFYLLLTGRLPFGSATGTYFEEILARDPKPPRQIVPQIPRELERLCLRCLAKRMTDRFLSVSDFAAELRGWLDRRGQGQHITELSSEAPSADHVAVHESHLRSDRTQVPEKIIPKGLRAFSTQDAGFFLQLLPGPRDRDGVPESINFWRRALEATTLEGGFAIGLLYGPSGCGKSSFLKAGLLPRLATNVTVVYLEATPDDLEQRLLGAVHREFPGLPENQTLSKTWRVLRDGRVLPPDRKVVVVIDQFEQWLHAHPEEEHSELARALRHCDGVRVQCLLAVRDDFGMAATRFMGELEIPIVQGSNFATIDRFSTAHARKVLAEFGRAFGQLPEADADRTPGHELFLNEAISWLAEDGKVIPVRLALFAEMIKDRPWSPSTLASFGDSEGVGVAFLDEAFSSRSANPNYVRHHPAVRRILQALLPERGTDIRGTRVQGTQLCEASGYTARPHLFEDVLRILDSELRLITPVEANSLTGGDSGPRAAATDESSQTRAARAAPNDRFYQLAHDYLVPSIRAWLTRGLRETRRGRAELLLAEQAAMWNARPTRRLLPTLWEWARLAVLTRRREWSEPQRRMMQAATRRSAIVLAVSAVLTALVIAGGLSLRELWQRSARVTHARHVVEQLLGADTSQVARLLEELSGLDASLTTPALQAVAYEPDRDTRERMRARLALLRTDPNQLDELLRAAWDADPDQLGLLIESFERHEGRVREEGWPIAANRTGDLEQRFRAACILARLDTEDARWTSIAPATAARLIDEQTLSVEKWAGLLKPAAKWLIPPLEAVYVSNEVPQRSRRLAAQLLAGYVGDDVERLAVLVESADHEQFAALEKAILSHRAGLLSKMEAVLSRTDAGTWPGEPAERQWPALSADVTKLLENGTGLVTETFAVCQTLAMSDFERIAERLDSCGYRPTCFRPYLSGTGMQVAAAWARDGSAWRWAHDQPAEEIARLDAEYRKAGFIPCDIACPAGSLVDSAVPPRFSALWIPRPGEIADAAMYLGVPHHAHESHWRQLNKDGFKPRVNLYIPVESGETLYSSVRWKPVRDFPYTDCWHSALADYDSDNRDGWYQTDVHLAPRPGGEPVVAAAWWDSPGWETSALRGAIPEAHLARCRELAGLGFRPLAVSVTGRGGDKSLAAASIWGQPVPSEFSRDALAQRQANAAAALLLLDQADPVWQHLRQTTAPFFRTWLVHRLAATGADPRRPLEQIETETDERSHRALLLALSRYAASASRPQFEEQAVAVAKRLWHDSRDSGVHSAAEHLLRAYGREKGLVAPADDSPVDALEAGRRWWVAPNGSTFAILNGPIEFQMGSSANETYHESYIEQLHRVRIPRTVAVSTIEVTLAQFLEFKSDFKYSPDYTPDRECPATSMTFHDAVRYCRWLSDKEHLPDDQKCYPSLEEIEDDKPIAPLPPNMLERTGYRLLTEAEWEYACRAGTVTSRPYGQSDELLPQYAWTFQTAPYIARPVARLLPNDFGLFDMLGNAMEYTQNGDYGPHYERGPAGAALEDRLDWGAFDLKHRIRRRGGAFLFQPSDARSAHRDVSNSLGFDLKFPFLGFRIARTVKNHP
jgi:serine/threonine protein kinase/formylglycine-generating enzyme required for sulfatase activity